MTATDTRSAVDSVGELTRLREEVARLRQALANAGDAKPSPSVGETLQEVLLDAMPCVALLLRPTGREIVAANAAARSVGAVPGATCFATWGQRHDPCPWCLAPRLWATGEAQHLQAEALGVVWDAHWLPVDGQVYLHYAFDITRQQALERRLHQAERLDALGQLAGGVAHRFSNQLASIMGCTDLLLERLDDPELRNHAELIRQAAARSVRLAEQLLIFARRRPARSEPVDLHRTIGEVVTLLGRAVELKIRVRHELAAARATVLGDPSLLKDALHDLGLNARDAMPQGGDLLFATRVVELRPGDAELTAGSYLEVRVSDTGVGIAKEHQHQVLEPFFTTKSHGAGLGLATAYGTVRGTGGTINLASESGRGTTFTLLLPLTPEEPAVSARADLRLEPATPTDRILLVEDESLLRKMVAAELHDLGYVVSVAEDGHAALEQLHACPDAVDLVILDLDMPRMGGVETAAAVRALRPSLPVLLTSGHGVTAEASELLEAPHTSFLPKPYRLAALSQKLHELLQG